MIARLSSRRSAESQRVVLYCQLLALDTAAMVVGAALATMFFYNAGARDLGSAPFLALLALFLLEALNKGSYSLAALQSPAISIRSAMSALMSALVLMAVVELLLKNLSDMIRPFFLVGVALSGMLLIVSRALFPRYAARVARGPLVDRLIVVDGRPAAGWHQAGGAVEAGALGIEPNLASPDMLERFGQLAKSFDCILIDSVPERQRAWALLLKGANVDGEILTGEYSTLGAIGIRDFFGRESLLVARKPLSMPDRIRKRLFDLALTVPIIIALSPILVIAALAVKFDSPGPVLFKQDRIGRGNRKFKVLKFRSMRVEGSDSKGTQSTQRGDSRVTRVGRIIRSTSIDELPQLFNVLLGDMSLVGPRPHPLGSLADGKLFWDIDETYWHRHQLKPGITGLAQVRGFRGATLELTDLTNRLQSDLEYVQGWSIWRDMAILVNTARVVVHPNAF